MSSRKPAALFGAPGRDALDGMRSREHQLDQFPLLQGRWVTGAFAVGSTLLAARHRLGRAYVGATSYMYLNGTGFGAAGLILIAPERARELTSGGVALAPERTVYLRRSTTTDAITIRFWVF